MQGFLYITVLILVSIVCASVCKAQVGVIAKSDSLPKSEIKSIADSSFKKIKNFPDNFKITMKRKAKAIAGSVMSPKSDKPDSILKTLLPSFAFKNQLRTKPLFKFTGGFNSYNFNYRSYIDTPFAEKNIYQHYANGSFGFSTGILPFRANYFFSKSNSVLFRNIKDVQILFDANQYKSNLYAGLKNTLLSFVEKLKDSVLEMSYKINFKQLNDLSGWLNSPNFQQLLTEYKEIINIPDLSYDINLNDSINKYHADSAQAKAKKFIEVYNSKKDEFNSLKTKVDSLEKLVYKMRGRIEAAKDLVNRKLSNGFNISEVEAGLEKLGIREKLLPSKYKWLLNIRRMGLGRNLLNYSELTSKNVSLKGVNFEYTSKGFYAAIAAGTVDYRYRDFIVNTGLKPKQYMYMIRIGKGSIEGNHLFFTFYQGQKQAYFSSYNNQRLLAISGISGELKYTVSKNINLNAEVAESMSADLRTNPVSYSKFVSKDNKNKAVAFKINSYFPKTRTKVDALYKYTGANFQSFSSFQTNSALKAWHVKVDQTLLKRKLKITAAIRTNDFSNPYILQQYNSNTVFKSVQATYHARRFPTVSFGYSPVSQLTKLNNQVIDNQFNSLNALLTHFYKIGEAPSSSSLMYNQFYNNKIDTGFAYYNASNIFFNQTVAFTYYSMNIAISQSKSKDYELNILDGGLQCKLGKLGCVGFGVKVNDFNKKITKTSLYGNLQLNLKKWGMLNMVYDNGYIPAANRTFVKNDLFNLVFTQVL